MNRDIAISGGTVVGVVVGLAVLLVGVNAHSDGLQLVGGAVVLLAVGLLSAYVMALE